MPGLQGESVVAPLASPIKKGRLSLKFFQKRETKRALDFSEPPTDEPKEEEAIASCDQVVPGPSPSPASPCALLPSSEKTEVLLPFVGLNNLGNTCYLNSVLQVLYYCPGLRDGIKKLYSQSKRKDTPKEEMVKSEDEAESVPAHMELLGSFNSLITSVEQLQSDFLLNPAGYGEGELATPPRKLLHTLRQLNPMYEGYLQHDAQEVLQCILGYIQEASVTIRKERQAESEEAVGDATEVKPTGQLARAIPAPSASSAGEDGDDGQVSGKRKSDTEAGNAKKKPKSVKSRKSDADDNVEKPFTRSKRKSSNAAPGEGVKKEEEEEVKKYNGEVAGGTGEGKDESASKVLEGKSKKRARMTRWLMPSAKQPSIFSKFRSMGKISSAVPAARSQSQTEQERGPDQDLAQAEQESEEAGKASKEPASGDGQEQKAVENQDGLDLLEQLFQGRLVLRTRCLECESYTERREDFQDISVPVQEDQPSSPDELPEVSPDPKAEHKTLKWAISQFASVERIVGEDKYFCETCLHYTEAERSLLFDKTPEVITIHLKCFSANGLELDPYAGLSKVNTPLQTPLTLSLEEWCARPSSPEGRHYQLFAVVMHSGVTISSGHYTAYVRMSDLQDVRLRPQGKREQKTEEEQRRQPGDEDGGRQEEEAAHYDDGEVSFCLGGARGPQRREAAGSGKVGGKKMSEGGVGLLGGQRRVSSSYELGSGKQADKTSNGGAKEGSRRRLAATPGPKKEAAAGCDARRGEAGAEAAATAACSAAGPEATEERALSGLLQYEGKWMLFDDSEVRLFEEEDFLRACSPDTCSTSTPYLLFYRRMPQHTSTC